MKMILNILEHLHSLARQQFAEIPVLDPRVDMLQFHTEYGTVK